MKMIIVTGANSVTSTDAVGGTFSFKDVIMQTRERAERYGYRMIIYDLGSLGIGEPFYIDDPLFQSEGHYGEIKKGYRSRSLFKPDILIHSMKTYQKTLVYLDGDALLYNRVDDVFNDEFDVGVTLRKKSEMQGKWYEDHFDIAKFINAGVIFLQPTSATTSFLERWRIATVELGNDQKALNELVCGATAPEPYSTAVIDGVRIKYFPNERYNYYYFKTGFPLFSKVGILHFKGVVRDYYPFTLRRRIYCTLVSPIRSLAGSMISRRWKAAFRRRGIGR